MSNFSSRVSTSSTFRVPTTRPKVFNATLPHLSVARDHCRRPSREQIALFRSRDDLGRPFREQNAPSRSRDDLGRPSREQNAPSRSRDNLGRPSREQNAPFRSRDALAYPSVSRTRRSAHETTLEDTDKPFLYQSYLLATLVHQTSLSCTKISHTVSLGLLFFLKSVLN